MEYLAETIRFVVPAVFRDDSEYIFESPAKDERLSIEFGDLTDVPVRESAAGPEARIHALVRMLKAELEGSGARQLAERQTHVAGQVAQRIDFVGPGDDPECGRILIVPLTDGSFMKVTYIAKQTPEYQRRFETIQDSLTLNGMVKRDVPRFFRTRAIRKTGLAIPKSLRGPCNFRFLHPTDDMSIDVEIHPADAGGAPSDFADVVGRDESQGKRADFRKNAISASQLSGWIAGYVINHDRKPEESYARCRADVHVSNGTRALLTGRAPPGKREALVDACAVIINSMAPNGN